MSEERVVDVVSGGLWGNYPPKRGLIMKKDEHLSEEIEIEEVCPDEEQEARDIQNKYDKRKQKYANKILGELEAFTERLMNEWRTNEEENELIDILSLVDNLIKAQLSANDKNFKG